MRKIKEESINKYKYIFSEYDKKPPSFWESLTQMFSSLNLDKKKINDLVEEIISKCKERIDPNFNEIKMKYENITKEDAYVYVLTHLNQNIKCLVHIKY